MCGIHNSSKHGAGPIDSLTDKIRINYAGVIIVFAMIMGGGTTQRLWTDHVLQIAMLPAMIIGFYNFDKWRLDTLTKVLVLAIIFLCLLQFLPFNPYGPFAATEDLVPPPRFWTMSAQGSLESILFTLPLLGLFVFISCFGEYEQQLLIRFIFLGFAINFVSGVIELSYGTNVEIEGVFPFTVRSGLFANENHFSTLVFMMIPLIAWRFMWYSKRPLIYIAIALLLVGFLFAVGSRAGMGISAALAVFCLFWKATEKEGLVIRVGALAVLIALAVISFSFLESGSALEGDLRLVFYKNTLKAIAEHWITGTGLGTFVFIYPMFEPQEDIVRVYANHAHNDYLELLLETGFLFFIPLMVLFFFQLFRHAMRNALTQAATLSVLAVLLHSLVDYPLRTMAIATIFTVLLAIILSKGQMTISPVEEPDISARRSRQSGNDKSTSGRSHQSRSHRDAERPRTPHSGKRPRSGRPGHQQKPNAGRTKSQKPEDRSPPRHSGNQPQQRPSSDQRPSSQERHHPDPAHPRRSREDVIPLDHRPQQHGKSQDIHQRPTEPNRRRPPEDDQ